MNYTTREMLEAIELRNPMSFFFARTFFPVSRTHIAEIIEVDVKKGRRRMAPFVAPRVGGKVLTRDGFKTNSFKTPKIAPERTMTIDDISTRGLGENIYSSRTPEERAGELLSQDMSELEEAIQNRKEWMARQVLLDGKIDIQNQEEGLDIQIDFGFTNKLVLAENAMWIRDTSDPIADLKHIRRDIIKKTGVSPNIALMSGDVVDIFVQHKKVMAAMNVLNLKSVVLEPRVIDKALTFIGRIQELDLDIYSYDEWFVDDEGKEQPMLPEGRVLVANSMGIGGFEYGSVTQIEESQFVTYEAEIVPKQWTDTENNIKKLRLTSRPVPVPKDIDSWYIAIVK